MILILSEKPIYTLDVLNNDVREKYAVLSLPGSKTNDESHIDLN